MLVFILGAFWAPHLSLFQVHFLILRGHYNRDPKRAHPKLTECERASLAHVDPDVNLDEEEFYFHHRGEWPSMEEFRKAQPVSGYPWDR